MYIVITYTVENLPVVENFSQNQENFYINLERLISFLRLKTRFIEKRKILSMVNLFFEITIDIKIFALK